MDELAQKDFTDRPSTEEFERCKKTWSIFLNTSGRNVPMKLRSDFIDATTEMHRLHRESGEERPAPIPFLPVSEMAFVVFFIQCIMVAVE